ncbi:hypothetical protein ACOMHN_062869 [Nucella lapillus]
MALPRSPVFPHSRRLSSEKGPTYHLELNSFRTGGTYMVKNPQVFPLPSFQDHCPTLSKASGALQPRFPTPPSYSLPPRPFQTAAAPVPPPSSQCPDPRFVSQSGQYACQLLNMATQLLAQDRIFMS